MFLHHIIIADLSLVTEVPAVTQVTRMRTSSFPHDVMTKNSHWFSGRQRRVSRCLTVVCVRQDKTTHKTSDLEENRGPSNTTSGAVGVESVQIVDLGRSRPNELAIPSVF